jgi:hypothetical protein
MKPLKLHRTTVRSLNNDEMSGVGGGTHVTRTTLIRTLANSPSFPNLTTTPGSDVHASPRELTCTAFCNGVPTSGVGNPGGGF